MELWIPITITAAFLQNLRSTLQKQLKGVMGTTGATFVRFGFGVPFAALYWVLLIWGFDADLPHLNRRFAVWVVIAAISQILATFLLIQLFSLRNFAVGNAYARTEPVQTALFAFVLFGVQFSLSSVLAILMAVVGLALISVARTGISREQLMSSNAGKTALIGLGSGTLFALAAIGFQTAARSVGSGDFVIQAATTLLVGIVFQTILMLLFMNREEIIHVIAAWKTSLMVGFVGATATLCWFAAFTLQEAALVKVVAQVEMLFAFGSSVFVFKEAINRPELVGCLLIVSSILCLILID